MFITTLWGRSLKDLFFWVCWKGWKLYLHFLLLLKWKGRLFEIDSAPILHGLSKHHLIELRLILLLDALHEFQLTLNQLSLFLNDWGLFGDPDSTCRPLNCRCARSLIQPIINAEGTDGLQIVLLQNCSSWAWSCFRIWSLLVWINRLRLYSIEYQLHSQVICNVLNFNFLLDV